MAVPEQTPYQEYTANGVATSFAVAFQCLSKDTLIVTINGVEQSSTLWSFTGGNIVFVSAPLNNSIVGIKRTTSLKREVTYNSYSNSMLPTVFNSDFDRIWHVLQEYQFSLDGKVATSRKINTSGNLQGGGSLEEDLTLSLKDQAVITDYQFGSSVKIPVITLNQDGTVKSIFESDLSGITPALTYIPWVNVLNKPTTLNGYGITNAYTKSEANTTFIEDSEKGAASGVATLAANSKIPAIQLPAATEAAIGAAEIATQSEVNVGTDDTRSVTPLKLKAVAFGIGQTLKDVTASRALGITYTNPSDKTILIYVLSTKISNTSLNFKLTVGAFVMQTPVNSTGSVAQASITFYPIPPKTTYMVENGDSGGTAVLLRWVEYS